MSSGVPAIPKNVLYSKFVDLEDTAVDSAVNGHVPIYNSTTKLWESGPVPGGTPQNIENMGLAGTTLTVGISGGGASDSVDLAPIIPAPPDPVNFHTLGEGQTDVNADVSTAPVNDKALIYTGGAWNQVSHDDWVGVINRDKRMNGDFDFVLELTTTPAQGVIGVNSGSFPAITDIYLNSIQFGQNYFPFFQTPVVVGDVITLTGREDSVLNRYHKGRFRVTAIAFVPPAPTNPTDYVRYAVTSIGTQFGSIDVVAPGNECAISFEPQAEVYATGVANAAAIAALPPPAAPQNISGSGLAGTNLTIGIDGGGTNEVVDLSSLVPTPPTANTSFASLENSGNLTGIPVTTNLTVVPVTTAVLANALGDFAPGPQSYNILYTGAGTGTYNFALSVGAYANQVDRGIQFGIFVNGVQRGGWMTNYCLNRNNGPESHSSIHIINQGLVTNDVIEVRLRLNDVNLPLPTSVVVESCYLSILQM